MNPTTPTTRILFLCLFASFLFINKSARSQSQCGCDFVVSLSASEFIFDGVKHGVKPGDKICFASGTRTGIGFMNVMGTAQNPVTITNMCDGKVTISSPASYGNSLEFANCQFIHVTGSGNPNEEYGIEVKGATMGVNFHKLSTDIEADHLNVNNVGCCGIVAKTDPECDPATWRGNFTMQNLSFHHNLITNTGCEGFYIGNSHYVGGVTKNCNGSDITIMEHDMYNVEVAYNTLTNIGNDGIQFSTVLDGMVVHHNTVYNFGTNNNQGHLNGIQSGAGCKSLVYNNIVDTGLGYGVFEGGRGNSKYYNNIIANTLTAFLVTDNPPYLPAGNIIANNLIYNTREAAVWMYTTNTNQNLFLNNIVITDQPYIKFNTSNIKFTDIGNIKTQDANSLKFVNAAAKDFHLLSTSPAKDAGVDLTTYAIDLGFDLDDLPRPVAPKWDIGPYEYQLSLPTSNAGPDVGITLPLNSINLPGIGTSPTGAVTYQWRLKSGGTATLANETTSLLTASDLEEGIYVFELTVSDANGSAIDEVTVTVFPLGFNQPPVANAGQDKTITLPLSSTVLNGTGTDNDGTVTLYSWAQVSGPTVSMSNADKPDLSLNSLVEGIYEFSLTVTDDGGATATDNVKVTVNPQAANQLPSVNAGADKTIFIPTSQVNITATASDPDGTIVKILWEKRSGPTATLSNTDKLSFTATNLVLGTYVFRITVTDDRGGTKFDEVNVRVLDNNQSPTANAGADKTITLPTNSIVINGSGSDTDGTIASYAWKKVTGGAASLTNQNKAALSVTGMVQGSYVFGLTVTDDDGATGYDEMKVTVNAAPVNSPPVVNAGPDKSITLPTSNIDLTGTATDPDGSISTITWSKKNGPTANLTNSNQLKVSITNMVAGTYTFTLQATDNKGASSSDDVKVTVLPNTVNQSPIANAGPDKNITLPTSQTTLNGAASDPDGTVQSVAWTKVSGPSFSQTGNNTNTLSLTNLVQGTYIFEFTVTDNQGAIAKDRATVTVNAANVKPTVNAGSDKTIVLPNDNIQITATANDPDGSIQSYAWNRISGPVPTENGLTTATLSLSGMTQGTYVYQITVTDNNSATATDRVTIYVTSPGNQLPVVSAGEDKVVYFPTTAAILTGSATDSDGTINTLLWTKDTGPNVDMANENTITLTLLNLEVGTYTFILTATDDDGESAFDEVTVFVFPETSNQLPIANAGGNKIIQLPTSTATLNGSGIDPDGNISAYQWQKMSGPNATVTDANSSNLSLSNLINGIYVFRLTVTDNSGSTAFDEMTLTVIPQSVNQNPIANAGQNQTLTLPKNNTNLVGSAFDPDGSVVSYQWSKVSGPAGETISTPNNQLTAISNLAEGTYIFRLTVTDNQNATGIDDIIINIVNAATNKSPIANAGGNQSLILPTNSINLQGTGFDPDGSIISYEWQKINGGQVTISSTNTAVLKLTNLLEGEYIFRLLVTDNSGATGEDIATITVGSQSVNQAPTVFAGSDKILKLPQNAITIVGSATDIDGSISNYEWTQTQGTPALLTPPTTTPILKISQLSEGLFTMRLTATDDDGSSAFDEMNIQVLPSTANTPPIVNAGGNVAVYLPNNSYTANATAVDDGTISSTLWTKASGQAATLSSPTSLTPTFANLTEGVYVFRLTVIDEGGLSSFSDLTITVFPPGVNKLPVVNAGADQSITMPITNISLTGSTSDEDGTIQAAVWSQQQGGNATLVSSGTVNSPVLDVTNMQQGTYTFRLTAQDNQGLSVYDEVKVIVNPIPPNMPPLVKAGNSQVVILPISQTQLNGSATDDDGTISKTEWKQISGPSSSTLTNPGSVQTNLTGLIKGTYIFRLTATDDEDAVAFSDVVILVVEESPDDQAPVAYAGEDILLVLPENETTIEGQAVDPDGFIQNYIWEQIGGSPTNYVFNEASLTITNLIEGSYAFKLTAIDEDGLSGTDEVNINVVAEVQEIPYFFSPNNDGTKDLWEFQHIEKYDQCSVVVFSRTGQQVYSTKPYQNNWDGTFNGKPLSDGDYYYIVSCDDGRTLRGAVRIIR